MTVVTLSSVNKYTPVSESIIRNMVLLCQSVITLISTVQYQPVSLVYQMSLKLH